jgi:uncharacterized membrane protein YidH (DUF202 family)
MSQPERVTLLDPSLQKNFNLDDDPFALPTRTSGGGSAVKNISANNNPVSRKNQKDLNVAFHTDSSQYRYNTYQSSDTDFFSHDNTDSSPQQVPIENFSAHENNDNKNNPKHSTKSTDFAFKPQSKYDMKNHMANERTFFKYLFTGLHIGSIGTLVLTFFPNDDIHKLYLVIMIWLVAFLFMFWGLYGYYRRKNLMEAGKLNQTSEISPHTPLFISSIFVGVILSVVWYGLFVHYKYEKGVSISKLLLMSEKETGGRRKGRRNRNGKRGNGGGKKKNDELDGNFRKNDQNNESNESNQNDSEKKNKNRQKDAIDGIYDQQSGSIIPTRKFTTNGDAVVNNDMDVIGFENEKAESAKTESATILPNFITKSDKNGKNSNKLAVTGEIKTGGILNPPKDKNTLRVQQTDGTHVDLDSTDYGNVEDDDAEEFTGEDEEYTSKRDDDDDNDDGEDEKDEKDK